MTTANTACLHCGDASSPPGAKFCVKCGQSLTGMVPCPNPKCRASVPQNARFCVQCGTAMTDAVSGRNRWARRPGDFACRIEIPDLKTVFTKGIAVDEGTRGLLFQDGQLVDLLDPGYHTLQTVADRIKAAFTGSPASVVLIDVADAQLQMLIGQLRTADGDEIAAEINLLVGLGDELDFFANLMRGQARVTTAELASRIQPQVTAVLRSLIGGARADELYGNRPLVEQIEDELEQSLKRSFERLGLVFHYVEFVEFSGGAYEEVRKARGGLRQDESRVEVEKDRALLERKVREFATEERMDKIQSEQDFDEFLKQCEQEAGLKNLLRTQEREELWRQYQDRKEDSASARQHLLAALGWQRKRERLARQMEYKRDFLLNSQELDTRQREHRLRELERDQQAKLDAVRRDFEADLDRTRRTRQADLDHRAADSDQEFRQLEREAELGIKLHSQWEGHKHQSAQQEIDRDLARRRGEQELRTAEEQARHRREQERLQTLGTLSTEALIAASDSDKAAMLAQLKETETLKGYSEEQILARAAAHSPEVARAFAEKFKSAAGQERQEQMETLYERMLRQQQESHRDSTVAQQENLRLLRDLMDTALKTQRDTAVAAAQGPQTPGPAVIYPPAGGDPVAFAGRHRAPPDPHGSPAMMHCPQCRSTSPAGSQFCGNCGLHF